MTLWIKMSSLINDKIYVKRCFLSSKMSWKSVLWVALSRTSFSKVYLTSTNHATFLQNWNACHTLLGCIYSAVPLKTVGKLLGCLIHHPELKVCISLVGVALWLPGNAVQGRLILKKDLPALPHKNDVTTTTARFWCFFHCQISLVFNIYKQQRV